MIVLSRILSRNLNAPEPERRGGIGWIGAILALVLSAAGFWIGAKIYLNEQHGEWFRGAVLGAFTLVNSLRILAYVPQMLTAARDANGASGVSYTTWSLFLVSHLTTIAYAAVYLGDAIMAFIFFGNALACLAVIAITFAKRRQYAARLMQRL
ncbi:MAG: hypothetical protein P9F75_06590 [Candidatus Contendobacter sp.]|nr:hypothetical protein [Candidatus Contendobacter sp.]